MHRVIRDRLEEVLERTGGPLEEGLKECQEHLDQCEECRGEIAAMRLQKGVLRSLRATAEPRPGFYTRVMERIEAQRPISIWNVFSESPFGRRIALASMALVLAMSAYLFSVEHSDHSIAGNAGLSGEFTSGSVSLVAAEDQPGLVLSPQWAPNRDAVLVNLVTYREQ